MEVKLRSKISHWPKILHRYDGEGDYEENDNAIILIFFWFFFSSNFLSCLFIIFSFRCGMTERPLHNANLVMAGLAMGCPGTPGGDGTPWCPRPIWAGSEGTWTDRVWSCWGWIIDNFRAGTVSGVGIVSPVEGCERPPWTGMVRRPAIPLGPTMWFLDFVTVFN